MARSIQSRPLFDLSSLVRRVRNMLRTVFTRGDFSTLIITCALMVVPVAALSSSLDFSKDFVNQSATWRVSLTELIPVAILAVVFGFLLARSHYSELFSLILSAIYCVAIVVAIQFFLAPGNPVQRVLAIITRLSDSLTVSMSRNTLDPYLLVLFLSVLVWFLGYNTAWHTFRLDRVWRAVLPPGIVLALDGFYNFSQTNIDAYLIIYVFLSLLLIIRSHIEAREFDWYMNRVSFQGNLRAWFFRSGAVLGLIMLVLAWVLPTGSPEENAKRFQEFLSGDVASKVTQLLNKLFGSLQGTGIATADYYGGDTLALGGTIQLGDGIVLVVKAPAAPRYYWKSRVFDTYDDNKWSSPRSLQITAEQAGLELKYPPTDPTTRKDVDQEFTMAVGTSGLIYAAPQPVKFGVPVQVDMDYVDQNAKTINPSVTRQLTHLQAGDSYTVTSSISVATAAYLRGVPSNYPDWVKQLDLQLPPTITAKTRQLAQQIVQAAHATTEYDKAKAIEQWLRANIHYNETLPEPPANKELVDWMLFDLKQAYCTYYASAMIVMLRTLGIPARMAAGFAQGIFDPATQTYIVREHDAHTWVEVYFVGAGWVEFEPTSAQQSLERIDPNARPTATVQSSPTPTPTPSPTFTPTPSPTPNQNGAAPQPPPPQQQPQVTQTLTPSTTFTPTPSPTPPPPLRLLQLPPPVQNAITLVIALAIFIAVMSFAAVGALWWIEYRGLDRYSPVGRAYARLAIYARWLGVPFGEANTPLERGRRIAREVPQGSRPVTTITDMYIAERYARPRDLTPGEEDNALKAWRKARRSLIVRKIRQWLRRE